MKQKVIILIVVLVLTACSSNPSLPSDGSPSFGLSQTPAASLPVQPTHTLQSSATVTPLPTGGGRLLVAFYASGTCGSCIIIGDFLSGDILAKVPLSTDNQMGKIFWSPDGENIMYTDMTATRMNVLLFNLETNQSKKLGDYPLKGGTPEFVNSLNFVRWSYEGEYVMYDVLLEDGPLVKSYFATKDGAAHSYENGFTNWLPDNKTMFSIYGSNDSYNVDSQTFTPVSTGILGKFNAVHILQKFIVFQRDKTNVAAIPFPTNWNDPLAWQSDTLNSQIVTLSELSKEIKNAKISTIFIVDQIDDDQIVLIGAVLIANQLSYFLKVVDLQNLPAEINADDIFQQMGDTPLIVSPDGNYYLKGYCTFIEACSHYDPDWKNGIVRGWGFKVVNFNGVEQTLPTDLSQFSGVTKAGVNITNSSDNLLDGMAFYWK